MIFLVDFDGTCVTHDFPEVGKDIGAVPVLKALVERGHKIILFTVRCDHDFEPVNQPDNTIPGGTYLKDAVKWFDDNGIPLFGINVNPEQIVWSSSPKAYGHYIIDDTAIGCPLIWDKKLSDKPFVNWTQIYNELQMKKIL